MKQVARRGRQATRMRALARTWSTNRRRIAGIARRNKWITDNLTVRKAANIGLASAEYVLKRERVHAWPVFIKVDISPLCNLRCTICVHARPLGEVTTELQAQRFRSSDKMSVEAFTHLADEVAGKTTAVSLYYVGDPIVHPHLEEICRVASSRGLNSHISTNFSVELSDDRLIRLVESGLTHLTVCVDGLSQDTYGRTRVGGRIDLVLNNLERLLAYRTHAHRKYPRVEVQYIKFQHNAHQLQSARRWCHEHGVDSFTHFWGGLHNYTDRSPQPEDRYRPRSQTMTPRCSWPHFAMVVKFDGSVIPCCVYRIGAQYAAHGDARVVGNAFADGIWKVWNSPEYQGMRRLVSNPATSTADSATAGSFCEGCSKLFTSDHPRPYVTGKANSWDDFYVFDERGRVAKRSQSTSTALELGQTRNSLGVRR